MTTDSQLAGLVADFLKRDIKELKVHVHNAYDDGMWCFPNVEPSPEAKEFFTKMDDEYLFDNPFGIGLSIGPGARRIPQELDIVDRFAPAIAFKYTCSSDSFIRKKKWGEEDMHITIDLLKLAEILQVRQVKTDQVMDESAVIKLNALLKSN